MKMSNVGRIRPEDLFPGEVQDEDLPIQGRILLRSATWRLTPDIIRQLIVAGKIAAEDDIDQAQSIGCVGF